MDDDNKIAWRFKTPSGPLHGFVKGAMYSLCTLSLWMSNGDNIDSSRRRCELCKKVAKSRGLECEGET